MIDVEIVIRALDWMKANDPVAYEEARRAFEEGDVEELEELVSGVPDRDTGRLQVGEHASTFEGD